MWQATSFDEDAEKRIDQAIEFEKTLRLESFLNLSVQVGKYSLRQITCRDLLELELGESSLIHQKVAHIDDLVFLLLRLSDEKKTKNVKRFVKRAYNDLNNDHDFYNELVGFFNLTFNDLPSSGSSTSTSHKLKDSSIWLASTLDLLCHEYGWTLEYILDLPASTVFQFYQRILKRHLGDKYSISNKITQKARADEMKRVFEKE